RGRYSRRGSRFDRRRLIRCPSKLVSLWFGRARRLPGFRSALTPVPSPRAKAAKGSERPDAITTARQPPSQEPHLPLRNRGAGNRMAHERALERATRRGSSIVQSRPVFENAPVLQTLGAFPIVLVALIP